MEQLLPYYERELVYLNTAGRELARRYPKLAAGLGLGAEGSDDPHIRRLIQACALLSARTAKKLDDDYPELTEALLGSLYPYLLQGMPSCSIVQVGQAVPGGGARARPVDVVPRGTEMSAPDARGVPCRFRTTSHLPLAEVAVPRAWFAPSAHLPPRLTLPPRTSGSIGIAIDSAAPVRMLHQRGLARLRLHVSGDSLLCAALLDSLSMHVLETWVEPEGEGGWRRVTGSVLALGGLDPCDALLPEPAQAHPSYRLLLEYFAFPDKFHFLDLDLALLGPLLPAGAHSFTLHFVLHGLQLDAGPARVLRSLGPANLLPGCAPVINLFHQSAAPVRITHRSTLYDVVPSRIEKGVEIVSIDAVHLARGTDGKGGVACRPFYGIRHGEAGGQAQRYWFACRDDLGDARQRLRISFTDDDVALGGMEAGVASIDLTCSNGAHACTVGTGAPGGDLACESATHGLPTRLLRKPSAPLPVAGGGATHWRLVTQLALNHRSLADLNALRDTLALYDLARSSASQRLIAGLTALATRPATAWLRNSQGAALVHGIEVRLTVDEDAFAGSSLAVFAEVISRFLGLYVHLNSFTQLVLVSSHSDKELLRCAPRNGNLPLL